MGIGNGQALLLRIMLELNQFKSGGSICELGSQVPLEEELVELIDTHSRIQLNGDYNAKDLYTNLGYEKYVSIDIN